MARSLRGCCRSLPGTCAILHTCRCAMSRRTALRSFAERELLELLNEVRRKRDETSAAPVEPDERTTVVVDALRKVEEDLGAGRVRFWSIKGIKSAA